MPIGKNALKRVSNNSYSAVKSTAPDMEIAEKLLCRAVDQGINYYDTAYIYPGSEAALGEILEKNGLRSDWVMVKEERFEKGGYLAMDQLLQCQELPQAVICANNPIALGLMQALQAKGVRIPEDMALITFDS